MAKKKTKSKGILHVRSEVELSKKDIRKLRKLFEKAARDPKGAVVVTRSGVTVDWIPV